MFAIIKPIDFDMRKITLYTLLLSCFSSFAQIIGRITDTKQSPLSFVSVYLDKTVTGTTSNDNGNYELDIKKKGDYIVVFQFLGYKTIKKSVSIASLPFQLDVILEDEKVLLDEISIATGENPANKIIRSAINSKDKNTDKLAKYTASFYSRGLSKIKNAPDKVLGQGLGDFGGGLDSTRSGIIYLSETISEIAYQKRPKKFKEKITASKRSGKDNGVSFNRAEDANFNFYDNNIQFATDLVSPISSNAFGYYRFKLEGTFYDKNGKLINKIKVIPKRKNDRVFKGYIYIVEDDWALYGVDVSVTGAQINIPALDTLTLKQDLNYSEENDSWVLISQSIVFKVDFFGFKVDGKFSYVYSNYNFTPDFTKNTFSNEVLTFAKEATKKDSLYWNDIRPVPLTREEGKDYILKDSIKVVRKSKKYLDSVDVKRNKFNLLSPITGYTYSNSYKKWSVSFNSPLGSLAYNTVKGWNASAGVRYFKRLNDKGKWINTGVTINYGISEKKIRPVFFFTKKWNSQERPRFSISGGITTPQFNNRKPISRLNNTVYSLVRKENYLKIYEQTFGKIEYSQEVTNGFSMSGSLEYANRKPLFNTTDYVTLGRNIAFQSNNPIDPIDFTAPFVQHNIVSLNIGAKIVFDQKYLSYPDRKFAIGNSKYPAVSINYRKNFGASSSEFNSDLFTANLRQFVSLGNFGNFRYNVRSGIFLQQKDIPFMDYLHANGNQVKLAPSNKMTSFGLLNYYQFSTNDKYAEAHIEHNFKGFLLSKIPLINKLNFHLVTGAKGLFTGERKPYAEYSIGLDNIGVGKWRFLRVDYVKSNFNGTKGDGFLFGITF
jgi:hypothetical protein